MSPIFRAVRPWRHWAAALALFSGVCAAQTASYTGQFENDDDLFKATFNLTSISTFTANTASFASGGFATELALFDYSGSLLQWSQGSGTGSCGVGSWDACMSAQNLPVGRYTLVLSQDGNSAIGPDLAAGFLMSGQHSFTQLNVNATSGNFWQVDGTQRTGQWALSLSAAGLAPVPEPDGLALMLAGLAGIGWVSRRRPLA